MSDAPTTVFVDTAGWLALFNRSDDLHEPAQQVMRQLSQSRARLVTSEFVLLEVADALSSPSVRARAIGFINGLRRWPVLQIVAAETSLLGEAWLLYSQRLDKDWSLTDCTSFVVMTRDALTHAFTSDRHFQQAGFTKLL